MRPSRLRARPDPTRTSRAARLAITVALGTIAACGGNDVAPGSAGTTTHPPSVLLTPSTPPGSTGTPAPPTSDPSSRPSVKATPSPGSTAPASSVVLDLKCARRGVDTQGITFKTEPGGPAGFNTQYSDGSSNVDGKSSYSGGYGGGFADSTGTWRMTWIVPDNAPTGVATVRTISKDGGLELKFTIVGSTATCPA